MGNISRSESTGEDFDDTLQELIDWKYVGVPKRGGIRKEEKKLFNFRKNRREHTVDLSSYLTTLRQRMGNKNN
jgi:hypothetical protein